MGSGKGSVEEWVAVVKAGTIILEVIIPPQGSDLTPKEAAELERKMQEARQMLKSAIYKLPKGGGERGKKTWKVVEKGQVS